MGPDFGLSCPPRQCAAVRSSQPRLRGLKPAVGSPPRGVGSSRCPEYCGCAGRSGRIERREARRPAVGPAGASSRASRASRHDLERSACAVRTLLAHGDAAFTGHGAICRSSERAANATRDLPKLWDGGSPKARAWPRKLVWTWSRAADNQKSPTLPDPVQASVQTHEDRGRTLARQK